MGMRLGVALAALVAALGVAYVVLA